MTKASVVLLVVMALVVGGCAAMTETWDGWFGDSPTPTPTPATTERAEVFYASVDGLAMHAIPSGSSEIVARLTQYQRVTRTGLARGYANVTTEAGLVGWVDNAQLLWRLPAAAGATPAPGAEPATAPPAVGGAETPAAMDTAAPAEPTTEAIPDTPIPDTPEPTATAPSAPTPTAPAAKKTGAAPGIFDPF